MKYIFASVLTLLALPAFCQRDFDFTLHSSSLTIIKTDKNVAWGMPGDTAQITIARKIEKKGSRICITNIFNSADEVCYDVALAGFMANDLSTLMYQTKPNGDVLIQVTPCIPQVVVKTSAKTETYK